MASSSHTRIYPVPCFHRSRHSAETSLKNFMMCRHQKLSGETFHLLLFISAVHHFPFPLQMQHHKKSLLPVTDDNREGSHNTFNHLLRLLPLPRFHLKLINLVIKCVLLHILSFFTRTQCCNAETTNNRPAFTARV